MANSPNVENRRVCRTLPIELCRKVEKKFRYPEDQDDTKCYIRALEESVRDVKLSSCDYELILEEVRRNEVRLGKKKKGVVI